MSRTAEMKRPDGQGFGFSIIGGSNTHLPPMISYLVKDSVSHKEGKASALFFLTFSFCFETIVKMFLETTNDCHFPCLCEWFYTILVDLLFMNYYKTHGLFLTRLHVDTNSNTAQQTTCLRLGQYMNMNS